MGGKYFSSPQSERFDCTYLGNGDQEIEPEVIQDIGLNVLHICQEFQLRYPTPI